MKIKTKKQLTLPQLIEWAWENDVTNKNLLADNNVTPLRISIGGEFIFDSDYVYSKRYTFTIEIEEEIDEYTVFEILLEIRKSKDIYTYSFESINKIVDSSTKELHAYIDGEFKLIWHNGKLVE